MNWPGEDERVACALDGARSPDDPEVAGLVAVAERVRQAGRDPRLDATPAFRDALRAQLLEQVPRPRIPAEPGPGAGRHRPQHAQAPSRRPGRVRRSRRRAAAAILAAVALSGTTLVASSAALPGDPLYGLKRRVQGVEVVLARGAEARGHRHLDLARTRVRELGTPAAAAGPPGPLMSVLEDMDRQTRHGVRLLGSVAVQKADDTRLAELSAWATEQRALLVPTAAELPEPARVRAGGSLELLTAILLRVISLHDTLRCDCPAPPMDDIGPVPCTDCGAGAPAERAARAAATSTGRPAPATPAPSGAAPSTPPVAGSDAPLPSGTPVGPRAPGRQAPAPAPTAGPTQSPSSAPDHTDTPESIPGLVEDLFETLGLGG